MRKQETVNDANRNWQPQEDKPNVEILKTEEFMRLHNTKHQYLNPYVKPEDWTLEAKATIVTEM